MAKYTRTQRKESTFCQFTMNLQLSKFISARLSVVSIASCPFWFICRHLAFHIRLTLLARHSRIRRALNPTIQKICTGSHVRFGFNEHSTYQTNFSWLRIRPAQQKNMLISDERTTNKTLGHLSTITSSDKQNNMGLQTHRTTTPKRRKPKSTQTHQPRNVIFFFLSDTTHPIRNPILAKIEVEKQENHHFCQPFAPIDLSIFKKTTCVLHHLAFLVWLPSRIFSSPNTCFQPRKPNFLMVFLPPLSHVLMVSKWFYDTFAVYFHAHRLAFSSILTCIQHQNALRLAPKCTAFSTKLHCIQHQNALHFAAKRTLFCCKQLRNWCKLRFYAMYIHFDSIHN